MDGQPEPARDRAEVAGRWGAEEPLEHARARSTPPGAGTRRSLPRRCRRTTNVHGTSGRLTSPETSWRNARSPSSATVRQPAAPTRRRRPAPSTRPRRSRSTPRLASTRGGIGCGGSEPLEVADRHGRRHDEGGTGLRRVAVHGAGDLRLAEIAPEHSGDGGLRPLLPQLPRRRAIPGRRVTRRRKAAVEPGDRPRRGGTRSPLGAGSAHCRQGSTTTTLRPGARRHRRRTRRAPRESQGAPSTTTVSGSGGCVRTMAVGGGDRPDHPASSTAGRPGPATRAARRARAPGRGRGGSGVARRR